MVKLKDYNSRYVYAMCAIAALGGVMFGYSTGVIAGAVDPIQQNFHLSSAQIGWVVSSIFIGCFFGSLISGRVAEKSGRKLALLIASVLYIVSSLGSAFADSFVMFSAARILCGVGVGMASAVAPMFMSEIAPAEIRGKASGLFNLSVVGSQTVVYAVNFLIAWGVTEVWLNDIGWRWMMGAQLVPAGLMFILTLILPESPLWNLNNGRPEKALAVYKKIYPNLNEEEANWIFQEKTAMKGDDSQPVASGKRLANPVMKYIMIIGCTIAVLQQITGANVMMYYAPLVLQTAETTKDMVFFQTIFIGLFNAIGAFIGMVLFDHFGRLPMMKIGTWGCIACLLLVSYGMYTGDTGYITVVSVVTFMVFFAIGWGAGTWVLVSEIFPAQIRGIGMGISVSMMWVFNFIIMQIFPLINQNDYLQSHFHGAFPMWIFVGFNLFCLWFLTKFVPETKGLSLEEIERTMASRLEVKTKRDSKVVTSH